MSKKRISKRGEYEIEELEDIELSPEDDAYVCQKTEEVERELEECRVNFRWQKEPLSVVKRAAAAIGIPYQTYIKQVIYHQAKADLGESSQPEESFNHAGAVAEAPGKDSIYSSSEKPLNKACQHGSSAIDPTDKLMDCLVEALVFHLQKRAGTAGLGAPAAAFEQLRLFLSSPEVFQKVESDEG